MVVETELDEPAPARGNCKLCAKPVTMNWFWFDNRWVHAPFFHAECLDRYWKHKGSSSSEAHKMVIPAKFREQFEAAHFKNDAAFSKALQWSIDDAKRVFAIVGLAGRGKSRLCWRVMESFFNDLHARTGSWHAPEVFAWADIMTDPEPYALQRMKHAPHAYISDIGSTEAFGRARALMQANIRYRIQRNAWTWLDIDDLKFDEDLGRVLKNEAFTIFLST